MASAVLSHHPLPLWLVFHLGGDSGGEGCGKGFEGYGEGMRATGKWVRGVELWAPAFLFVVVVKTRFLCSLGCLPSTGIKGVHPHTAGWMVFYIKATVREGQLVGP